MITLPNPYPMKNSWHDITKVNFVDRLVLTRLTKAVRARHGPDLEVDAEFIVCEPFRLEYKFDRSEKSRTVTVREGFLSDGVSVLGNSDRTSDCLEASIVHDYLYVAWQFLEPPNERKPRKYDQTFADRLFYKTLLASGISNATSWVMYQSVRTFGWSTYKERDPDSFIDLG